jgi:hypothetical protein
VSLFRWNSEEADLPGPGSADWLPTLVDIAGSPKGDGLKQQIEAGKYSGS